MNTSTRITTRPATLQDVPAIAALFDAYRQFYEQPADLALAGQFIRERLTSAESVIFVAQTPELELVGFCQLYPTFCSVLAQPTYTLYDLFVTPAARKTGAGEALMLAAEQHAVQAGKGRLDLSTAKTNVRAQALYEKLDWVRDNEFLTYSKVVTRKPT